MNRKRLLGILLLAFGASLVWAFTQTPVQQRIPQTDAPTSPTIRRAPATAPRFQPLPRVRLELLAKDKEPFPRMVRDIFGPLFPPEPPPMPPRPAPAPVSLPVPAPPVDPPQASVPPLDEVLETRLELARFRFIGFLLKDGSKRVFLGKGEDIFVVGEGGSFGEKQQFLVTDLSSERLVIRQAEHPTPIFVSLVEQQPLAPSFQGGALRTPRWATPPPVPNRPRPYVRPMSVEPPQEEDPEPPVEEMAEQAGEDQQ